MVQIIKLTEVKNQLVANKCASVPLQELRECKRNQKSKGGLILN